MDIIIFCSIMSFLGAKLYSLHFEESMDKRHQYLLLHSNFTPHFHRYKSTQLETPDITLH